MTLPHRSQDRCDACGTLFPPPGDVTWVCPCGRWTVNPDAEAVFSITEHNMRKFWSDHQVPGPFVLLALGMEWRHIHRVLDRHPELSRVLISPN